MYLEDEVPNNNGHGLEDLRTHNSFEATGYQLADSKVGFERGLVYGNLRETRGLTLETSRKSIN